ncbi:autotransporter beta-domain-containing protein, partial [gut metagenome]
VLRAEKLYTNGNTQVVPYIGLRYFNIDGDSYTSYYNGKAAFNNENDSQNVWTLPVGVSLRNETVTESGWRFTPKVDLAYIFAFGDTDNTVTVSSGSGMSTLSYDVMDSGSWLGSVALEAGMGAWNYGVGYSYQKGSDVENNKWF